MRRNAISRYYLHALSSEPHVRVRVRAERTMIKYNVIGYFQSQLAAIIRSVYRLLALTPFRGTQLVGNRKLRRTDTVLLGTPSEWDGEDIVTRC